MAMHLINEVSRQVDLSQKRIREYEKEGFIKPDRDANTNNRLYSDFDIAQIKRINALIHDRGFTLACLRNLLLLAPCWNVFGCLEKELCAAFESPHTPCYLVRERTPTRCLGPCERCAIWLNKDYEAVAVLEREERIDTGEAPR